jgi:hypothetical protein
MDPRVLQPEAGRDTDDSEADVRDVLASIEREESTLLRMPMTPTRPTTIRTPPPYLRNAVEFCNEPKAFPLPFRLGFNQPARFSSIYARESPAGSLRRGLFACLGAVRRRT